MLKIWIYVRFDVADFANGIIMGHRTSASLDVEDLYHIGELSIIYEETDLAVEWMSEVILQEQKSEENKKGLREKVWIDKSYSHIYQMT